MTIKFCNKETTLVVEIKGPRVAIPGCQLEYIWNELQSRTGHHTCDTHLEDEGQKFLTWILALRS